jgi:DNA-binding MarR family transcriptional regulator
MSATPEGERQHGSALGTEGDAENVGGQRDLDSWSTHRLLMMAARFNERRINLQLAPLGLTTSGLAALTVLDSTGPATQAALAGELEVGAQSIGKVLLRLESRGYLVRERGAIDNRSMRVTMTADGADRLRQARSLVDALPHAEDEAAAELRRQLRDLIRSLGSLDGSDLGGGEPDVEGSDEEIEEATVQAKPDGDAPGADAPGADTPWGIPGQQ